MFIGTQDLAASEKFVFGSDLKRGMRGAVSSRDQPRWSPPPGATRLILRMGLETRQVQSVKLPSFQPRRRASCQHLAREPASDQPDGADSGTFRGLFPNGSQEGQRCV